jgi:uncharacterized protein
MPPAAFPMLAFLTATAPRSPRTHQEAGMTGLPPDQAADAQALRATLRRGLTAAMKARDTEVLAALRTAIAAIDNAEAVAVPADRAPVTSEHIAGASSGAGSAEAARRQLDGDEVRRILRDQADEQAREADRFDELGQADAARRLRRRAEVIAAYL